MGGASLNAAVEIVSGNFSDYAFIVNPAMMWGRAGAYDVSDSSVRVVRLIKYYEYPLCITHEFEYRYSFILTA